jgi:hypothetical protein
MPERLKGGERGPESIDLSLETERNRERLEEKGKRAEAESPDVEKLQAAVEQKAVSGQEVTIGEREQPQGHQYGVHKELKTDAYQRSLKRIRSRLSAPERAFSRMVHQPAVEAVSNALARTVARPSGVLGAGIFALVGSSLLLYIARTYGFTYNYFAFFALLAAGYLLGLFIELIGIMLRRKKKSRY